MLLVLGVVVGFGTGGIGIPGVNDADGLNAGAVAAVVGKNEPEDAGALGLKTGAVGALGTTGIGVKAGAVGAFGIYIGAEGALGVKLFEGLNSVVVLAEEGVNELEFIADEVVI
jgi:hypothetical protein